MLRDFIGLGERIISCDDECSNVIGRDERERGCIPRVLILCGLNGNCCDKKAKVGVFGINPGRSIPFEANCYKMIFDDAWKSNYSAFEKIHELWISEFFKGKDKSKLLYLKYFINTKKFLLEIGLKEDNPVLWGEIVYCERMNNNLSAETKIHCAEKFMSDVVDFIDGNLILCLGGEAYNFMKNIKIGKYSGKIEEVLKKLQDKKILGIYHPSGSRVFYKYFNEGDNITSRSIKENVKDKVEDFIKGEKQYGFLKFKNNNTTVIEP